MQGVEGASSVHKRCFWSEIIYDKGKMTVTVVSKLGNEGGSVS